MANKSFYSERRSLFTQLRLEGFGPPTFGSVDRKSKNLTYSEPNSYQSGENHLTTNLTENSTKIQQDLEKINAHYSSLPEYIKLTIMTLIETEPVQK